MPTRAAAKREAAFLEESLGESALSSAPTTPAITKRVKTSKDTHLGVNDVSHLKYGDIPGGGLCKVHLSTPSATAGSARKRTPAKIKRKTLSMKGDWDVLPHGLGKKGDLLGVGADGQDVNAGTMAAAPKKRARRSRGGHDEDNVMLNDSAVKVEDKAAGMMDHEVKEESSERIEFPVSPNSKARKGRAKKTAPTTPESSGASEKPDPITAELLEEFKSNSRTAKGKVLKAEDRDTDIKQEGSPEELKKKRAAGKPKSIATSQDVVDKVADLLNAAGQLPKTRKRKKAHPYGLTPGYSPFPDFVMPTPEACEEVTRLLSGLHGEVKAPEIIPPPSLEVTGCGEVPDLLDAILRTLLSASTTARNSNMALQGLREKFGLRTSGVGQGSINWEAVYQAELPIVIDAIKSGGLAKVKGTNIKKILDAVYEENSKRRDALLKEKVTGAPANVLGANHESEKQKYREIAKFEENMLSMDHVFEMTTEEAMEEMTKLPGIGVKTASCVILFCMKRPSFAVDTHVWRHCKWLGWVPPGATRDQTFSHCEVRIPDYLKYPLHQLFLKHGKSCGRCRANTSYGSEDWENANCPIDHLMNRTEKKKHGGASPMKKAKSTAGKKGGKSNKGEDTEESEVDMSEHDDEDESDVAANDEDDEE